MLKTNETKDSKIDVQNILDQLKNAESIIKDAEAEIRMRNKRLQELIPKKKNIEDECQDKFSCTPSDLPQLQQQKLKIVDEKTAKLNQGLAEVSKIDE